MAEPDKDNSGDADANPDECDKPEDDEGEGGVEEPVGPTHDPFSFSVLKVAQTQQSLNGLRHNDHLRYKQYCSRRLRRLYTVLKFKHGKGRFKNTPLPDNFDDMRFLEIPLVSAERAWSFAVQLKSDNATSASFNPRWRHHSIQRLSKAVRWARKLDEMCKVHADQRSQLEAETYLAFMEGIYLVEKEEYADALTKLRLCRRVCERLALASGPQDATLFKNKVQDLQPMLRECKYNLGMTYDEDGSDDGAPQAGSRPQKDLSELKYRGQGLVSPSDKIKGKLLKCLGMVSDLNTGAGGESGSGDESGAVIEKYGELSAEFADALKDIHSEMINAGSNEEEAAEWRMLEAYARELSLGMNVERNMTLLSINLNKLDGLEEIGSADARRQCRPEEGMRFCELLKEDLESLLELPETGEEINGVLTLYTQLILNCRCFLLAMCHLANGKFLEAAALLDMLQARVDEVELLVTLPEPLGRMDPLFKCTQKAMPRRVVQWRCRGIAQLCAMEARASAEKEKEDAPIGNNSSKSLEESVGLGTFPPGYRDIPCKPLLFDLAFPCIEQPDVEDFLAQSKPSGQQKSLLGRVAGGLGNRIGSLWGRK